MKIRIEMSPESLRVIEQHAERPSLLIANLRAVHRQWMNETESHLKARYLAGGDTRSKRRGRPPLAVRSRGLQDSTFVDQDTGGGGNVAGDIGAGRARARKYARMQLGKGTTTIRPVSAKYLWIPIADNLTRGGRARMSPRDAMSRTGPTGKRLLQIFRSRRGNLVAVMPDAKKKRGRLLFALKESVTVEGTDALARSVEDRRPRMRELLRQAIHAAEEGRALN